MGINVHEVRYKLSRFEEVEADRCRCGAHYSEPHKPGCVEVERRSARTLGHLHSAEDYRQILESYFNSQVCMLLFAKLTLYRASGENPKIKVQRVWHKGKESLRVRLERSNGDVEHFNRDGES